MKKALSAATFLMVLLVLQCSGGESGGGGASPVDPGPLYIITGAVTSPAGWGSIEQFAVHIQGTPDTGGSVSGTQALYPCDGVTCDCVGICNYTLSAASGTYTVTVSVSPAYGNYVSTPAARTIVVSGADTGGHDFQLDDVT